MLGLMQNQPLMISSLIEFADRHHGEGEVVSRRVEGDRSLGGALARSNPLRVEAAGPGDRDEGVGGGCEARARRHRRARHGLLSAPRPRSNPVLGSYLTTT